MAGDRQIGRDVRIACGALKLTVLVADAAYGTCLRIIVIEKIAGKAE